MSFTFNGVEPEVIMFNGTEVETLIFNGVEVWNATPENYLIYKNKIIRGVASTWGANEMETLRDTTTTDYSTTNLVFEAQFSEAWYIGKLAVTRAEIPSTATMLYVKYSCITDNGKRQSTCQLGFGNAKWFSPEISIGSQNSIVSADITNKDFNTLNLALRINKQVSTESLTVQFKIHDLWYE